MELGCGYTEQLAVHTACMKERRIVYMNTYFGLKVIILYVNDDLETTECTNNYVYMRRSTDLIKAKVTIN